MSITPLYCRRHVEPFRHSPSGVEGESLAGKPPGIVLFVGIVGVVFSIAALSGDCFRLLDPSLRAILF